MGVWIVSSPVASSSSLFPERKGQTRRKYRHWKEWISFNLQFGYHLSYSRTIAWIVNPGNSRWAHELFHSWSWFGSLKHTFFRSSQWPNIVHQLKGKLPQVQHAGMWLCRLQLGVLNRFKNMKWVGYACVPDESLRHAPWGLIYLSWILYEG